MERAVVGSGIDSLDRLVGGAGGAWIPGDNVVWVGEYEDPYPAIEAAFVAHSAGRHPTVFVATSRSELERPLPPGIEVVDASPASRVARPGPLSSELETRLGAEPVTCVVVDGLDVLARRWGRDEALAFFVRTCPMMLQAEAVTYWRMPRGLGPAFLERVRRVTQCLLEVRGDQIQVTKAEGRPASVSGSTFRVVPAGAGEIEFTLDPARGRLARGLHAVRRDLGLTQAQLADVAGITPSAVSQAEAGTRGLSLETVIRLSDRLGVTVDRLVDAQPLPGYRLARHDRSRSSHPGVVALADDARVGLRAFLVTLGPGEHGAPPSTHLGVELVTVLRGLVQIDTGEDTPALRAGDSLLAETVSIAGWRNLRSEPAAFVRVLRD